MASLSPPVGFRGLFRTDEVARAVYSEAAGIGRIMPQAVAVPTDAADVQTLVRWARDRGTPLIPRGSGSSMAGGAIGDGVIVDLSRLREIGPVNAEARSIVVEPGAVRGDVNRAAEAHGLRFPVDPSSGSFCTIGGMVSTNAAGAHSLFFGSTRRWVRSLRCIFEDGSIADVRRGAPAPDHIQAVARFLRDAHPIIAAAEEVSRARHTGVRPRTMPAATTSSTCSRAARALL